MKNQSGFATLEIILVTVIISLLAFVGVPKLTKIFDVVMLDYEVKSFCNELEFARTTSRTAFYTYNEIFDGKIPSNFSGKSLFVDIFYEKNFYKTRQDLTDIREPHRLSGGITLQGYSNSPAAVEFTGESSESGTVYFSSRLGNSAEVRLNTVGRWRGYRDVK